MSRAWDERNGSTRRWRRTRARLIAAAGYQCTVQRDGVRCTNPVAELHHIVALADGGTDHDANLTPVCQGCHRDLTRAQDHARQQNHLPRSRDW